MAIIKNPITVITKSDETDYFKMLLNNESGEYIIPQGTTSIKSYTFAGSNATSVIIPSGVLSIGERAFQDATNFTEPLIFPNTLTSIGYDCFYRAKLVGTVVIPESVTTLSRYCFEKVKGFTKLVINSVYNTYYGLQFEGCSDLEIVVFRNPAGITDRMFSGCSKISLYDYRLVASVPLLYSLNSLGHASGCKIAIPFSLYDTWTTATNWASLTDVIWVAGYTANSFDDIPSADRVVDRYYVLNGDTDVTTVKKWNGTSWEDLV